LHVVFDETIYANRQGFVPLVAHLMTADPILGLYFPIVYPSDFWVLMRDLFLLDQELIERIARVRKGETQTGEEGMDERAIKKLNYDGKVKLTWDNYSLTYASYQEQFKLSMKQ